MLDHRLILLATPRQVGVLDWRPGHLHWLGDFSPTEKGMAAFREVIAKHSRLPTLVVVDTVDEDYRSETLPHVKGHAQVELLNRKLKQVFRNARFIGAWRQARETTGRRDDRYLFAALTDADWLTPWLALIYGERVPLYGITPLALASQHLLSRLRPQEPHTLLAYRLNNRLRLSYYHDGQLRFSRLVSGDTPTQLPGNAADEIAKTQLYLTGQRILPREARLHVLLCDSSGQLDAAQAQLNADPAFSARVIDVESLGRALRIPENFLAATPDVVPLAAIAGETPELNLAPAELLQHYTEFRWRRGLRTLAAAIAGAGLIVTASDWFHAQDLLNEADALARQTQQIDARYAAIARSFPPHLPPPEQLAKTVETARTLAADPIDVHALYAAIGQVLAAYPDIRLDALAWSEAAPLPANAGAVVRVDGSLTGFDGNYRRALQRIESLMQHLSAVPTLHDVRLRTSPVNADSSATLTGQTRNGGDPALVAAFSVELTYRPGAAP
ncbi:MAG: monoheme cytochrome SoxX [Thiobacillus sp.]